MEKQTFNELGIKPEILEILSRLSFSSPTPIQYQAIPEAIKENDIIGIAQTGTGKTLAFGIPTIQKLMSSQGTALIILPTRELALQVDESLAKIGKPFNLRSAVLIGGQNMNKQMRDLKANPRIIISTPGRLIDHLERKTVRLNSVKILVLDEADRMLDMGFAPQVERILREVPKDRQTMLFSATMPSEIVGLANRYMKTPLRVEVAPAGSATENVTHEIFFVKEQSKLALLEVLLKGKQGSVLVFSRTKHGAKKIALALNKNGFSSTEIHSNRTLAQRMRALEGFKKGKFQIMVATDIAARGIDVKGIELVVNYDLPSSPEDYVHRIGRTGRAENLGHAISFATPKQTRDIRIIERLIKKELPVSRLPELPHISAPETRTRTSEKNRNENFHRNRRQAPNARRDFFPERPEQRRTRRATPSPAQKGREFYKDFDSEVSSSPAKFGSIDRKYAQNSNYKHSYPRKQVAGYMNKKSGKYSAGTSNNRYDHNRNDNPEGSFYDHFPKESPTPAGKSSARYKPYAPSKSNGNRKGRQFKFSGKNLQKTTRSSR